ncbi:hypothetical protein HN935_00325 [archaeon]|jgi:hypothetical protein|nr:hypothetical protein [archaeon]
MEGNYLEAEKLLRKSIEANGDVSWAAVDNKKMGKAYGKLVDIFGNELSSGNRQEIVQTMIRNSGYSETAESPETIFTTAVDGENQYDVAACVYLPGADLPVFVHEGTHFLAHYGPKAERIIQKDIPLANVLEYFFRLRQDPSRLEEITGGVDLKTLRSVAANPFLDDSVEHSNGETREAIITAVNAYAESERHGEQAGIAYIRNLMVESNA